MGQEQTWKARTARIAIWVGCLMISGSAVAQYPVVVTFDFPAVRHVGPVTYDGGGPTATGLFINATPASPYTITYGTWPQDPPQPSYDSGVALLLRLNPADVEVEREGIDKCRQSALIALNSPEKFSLQVKVQLLQTYHLYVDGTSSVVDVKGNWFVCTLSRTD